MSAATFDLNARQRSALSAIADTFAPGDGQDLPSASELGVIDAIVGALRLLPHDADRKQVAMLLNLWDGRLLTAIGGGGPRRFSALDQATRERVLRGWCDSRVGQRRGAFQALRKAVLISYYTLPAAGGGSPVWDRIGYDGGAPGAPADPPPPALTPYELNGERELTCDVVVVGSGAGGGTAAGVLAAAGLDVVVLEAGGFYSEADFDGGEANGYSRLYLNGGGTATADAGIGLLAGACLGGGTTVNYSTAFRTPDNVRAEWASLGVEAFAGEEYTRSLDAVSERLGVNREHTFVSKRDHVMQEGATSLGWATDIVPRNTRGCGEDGKTCSNCGFGCPRAAKQGTMRTWLADAHKAGARILVNTPVDSVIVEGGVARGVRAHPAGGGELVVRSRVVIAACGAIHTPALLKRSGLENPNIGKHLRIHPAMAVFGVMEEELRPWEGTMQAVHVDEHRDLDGNGYGVKYQTAPLHPGFMCSFAPWRSAAQHLEMMETLPFTAVAGVLIRDKGSGEVKIAKDGQPVVHYQLDPRDIQHMRRGVEGGAEMLESAGARRVFTSHAQEVAYRPGVDGDRARMMRDADAAGWGPGQAVANAFHLQGSARMGGSPDMSACGPTGETWDVRGLYVCDGSAFPTASGVNPMLSIESIAHMNATGIAAALAG